MPRQPRLCAQAALSPKRDRLSSKVSRVVRVTQSSSCCRQIRDCRSLAGLLCCWSANIERSYQSGHGTCRRLPCHTWVAMPCRRLRQKTFSVSRPILWNSLPEHIRHIDTLIKFNNLIRTHFLKFQLKNTPTVNENVFITVFFNYLFIIFLYVLILYSIYLF